MDNSKANIIKFSIVGAISLAAAYFIYKLASGKGTAPAAAKKTRTSKDSFTEIIDQRLPMEEKQKEAHEFVT